MAKFKRIDFKGSFLFALTVLSLLFPLEMGGVNVPWSHPMIGSLLLLGGLLLMLFIAVEKIGRAHV